MGVDFEQEIREIFGTTDLTALREISKAANEYQHMVEKSVRKQASGREKFIYVNRRLHVFLPCRVRERRLPVSRSSIEVSRQTIYSQIQRAHQFSDDPDVRMRMNFMNRDWLCTTIDIDFRHEKIAIQNYTDQIPFACIWSRRAPGLGRFSIFSGGSLLPENARPCKGNFA